MRTRCLLLLGGLTLGTLARADPAEAWTRFCLSCHGARGSGDTKEGRNSKLPDMRTAGWQASLTDEELGIIIRDGKKDTKMKPFGRKVSEADLKGLVARIRTFSSGAPASAKRDR